MQFRLTFEGKLKSNGSPKDKHEIRKKFHPQLRAFWESHPYLKRAQALREVSPNQWAPLGKTLREYLADEYARLGYNFVPMVTEQLSLICSLDVLFLRPGTPGTLIKSGDIDGRLKTLFDALRIPDRKEELGGYNTPSPDEKPFYCLLQDDKLVAHVSVTTDTLLQPTLAVPSKNDTRLVITVGIKPFEQGWHNINFGAA